MDTIPLSPAISSFGYAAALQAELTRIGPLSIEEFERRYTGSPADLPAPQPGDPLGTARYGETFSQDPKELIRQRIAQGLDALLPGGLGPSVPEAALTSLLHVWDACQASGETDSRATRDSLVECTKSYPLLTVVLEWDGWEGQRLEALRGLRFETGSELLAWLEADEALRRQQIGQRFSGALNPAQLAGVEGDLSETLARDRQDRLHKLHHFLTGHYGLHADFRLTDREKTLLDRNGFVVTQRLGARSFGDLYYHLFNNDLPVFITIDSLLHAWHHSYDALLMEVEETCLRGVLDAILRGMSGQLPAAQQAYGLGILKQSLLDVDFYLAMTLSLLHGEPQPTRFGQEKRVAAALEACAAERLLSIPLFGSDRDVDFSQFKPRGHYEKSESLQRYFRAMMWVGRIDLRLAGGDESQETTARQLGAALILLDLLHRADQFLAWQQFDHLLQAFIGVTDSLTFAQLDAVLRRSEIRSPPAITHWTVLERLQADILRTEAGFQQIASGLFVGGQGIDQQTALPRSFTLLGQKFTLDSWAMGQMVYDRVQWAGEPVMRRIPSCLDVAFAVLGNDQAAPDLVARMRTTEGRRYRDGLPYQHHLAALRNLIDAQDDAVWETSLYTRWLHCLRALSAPTTGPEYPQALRTRAWAAKSLNTQMASWTQLRHDTILYVGTTGKSVGRGPTSPERRGSPPES